MYQLSGVAAKRKTASLTRLHNSATFSVTTYKI